MDELSFKLEKFEGPLDLLLRLIAKNQLDIYDIPISWIFDQYMEYLDLMKQLDMDVAGEFITMAAELMLIKSQMLLPRNEEEETPLQRLQMAVMEYAKAKNAAMFLREQWSANSGAVTREPQEPERGLPLHYELSVLEKAFRRMLARSSMMKEIQRRPEQTLENLLKHKVTPIPVKVIAVMRHLYKYGETDFETILLNNETRSDLIATFAAVLELVKFQRVFLSGDEENPTLVLNMSHDIGRKDSEEAVKEEIY
jgi:segregation and condensation protein A